MPVSARGLAIAGWRNNIHGTDMMAWNYEIMGKPTFQTIWMFPKPEDEKSKHRRWRQCSAVITGHRPDHSRFHFLPLVVRVSDSH